MHALTYVDTITFCFFQRKWWKWSTGVSGAVSDGTAASLVGIGPLPLLAVVVGVAAAAAGDLVGLKGVVANVGPPPRQAAAAGLRVQQHLVVVANEIPYRSGATNHDMVEVAYAAPGGVREWVGLIGHHGQGQQKENKAQLHLHWEQSIDFIQLIKLIVFLWFGLRERLVFLFVSCVLASVPALLPDGGGGREGYRELICGVDLLG